MGHNHALASAQDELGAARAGDLRIKRLRECESDMWAVRRGWRGEVAQGRGQKGRRGEWGG
jgi:hypothetical protein